MKYLVFMLAWIALYLVPAYAGDWYDARFNLYQSTIPLALILLAKTLIESDKARFALYSILLIQIFLNLADFLINLAPLQYNSAQAVLNILEIFVLTICGIAELGLYADSRRDSNYTNHGTHGSR